VYKVIHSHDSYALIIPMVNGILFLSGSLSHTNELDLEIFFPIVCSYTLLWLGIWLERKIIDCSCATATNINSAIQLVSISADSSYHGTKTTLVYYIYLSYTKSNSKHAICIQIPRSN